jgi:hypothetical protein
MDLFVEWMKHRAGQARHSSRTSMGVDMGAVQKHSETGGVEVSS